VEKNENIGFDGIAEIHDPTDIHRDPLRGFIQEQSFEDRMVLNESQFTSPAQKAFIDVIKEANSKGGTDIGITSGDYGRISILKETMISKNVDYRFKHEDVESILKLVVPEQWSGISVDKLIPANFSFSILKLGHYRVCALGERHGITLSIRKLPFMVPTVTELGIPDYVVKSFMTLSNGLFLVTGPTGSGKSTTIAALLNKVNEERKEKIITIEDPIEYVHLSQGSHIVQIEVGVHVKSFQEGIFHALRSNPSIIQLGEIREKEAIETCLDAAESGHLVISSFHVGDTVSAIERLMHHVDDDMRRLSIVSMLKAVVNQRLFVKEDKETGHFKFYIACEFLSIHNDPAVKTQIMNRDFERLRTDLASYEVPTSKDTVSFTASLNELTGKGYISWNDVCKHGYYDLYFRKTKRVINVS